MRMRSKEGREGRGFDHTIETLLEDDTCCLTNEKVKPHGPPTELAQNKNCELMSEILVASKLRSHGILMI